MVVLEMIRMICMQNLEQRLLVEVLLQALTQLAQMALGTTLGSFLPLLHDLSSYKGISNLSDIRMLRRATEDSDWEEYPNQSVVGNTIVCTAVGAFSQWVPDSVGGDALPVELTSFTAKSINNSILLAWQTATEVNNYGFEIHIDLNKWIQMVVLNIQK
jgi:hypothetical protein